MELKYIITNNDCFAIFSPTTEHFDVAKGLWGRPVGAGFCDIRAAGTALDGKSDDVSVHCYGESSSLRLSSRPEDEVIINRKAPQRKGLHRARPKRRPRRALHDAEYMEA